MQIRWLRLILGAIAAEIAAILALVCVVAIFGPNTAEAAQAYAQKAGRWVGPWAGALFSFIGAVWVGRSVESGKLIHGVLFGFLLALVDVVLLLAMRAPFEWVLVVSDAGKIIAGSIGGFVAARIPHEVNQAR